MATSTRDFVQSLERGLVVIRSFNAEHSRQSLSDVARRTGYSRAACRRLLLTLEHLGYVGTAGRSFFLLPSVLDLGYSYLSALPFRRIVEPFMEDLSTAVRESVSVSVLDGTDVVYVSRVATPRIMTVSFAVGDRQPAYHSSMGRVLLAALPEQERRARLAASHMEARTKFSLVREDDLLAEIAKVAKQGYALIDQELEIGLRSIAAPIKDPAGRTVAAMNISTHVARSSLKELRTLLVPQLLATTERVNALLAKR